MVSISVVMPTFNTTATVLREAVESILSQSFGDFEFIIIDDGSTDDSYDYLQTLRDKRIRLIRNPENLGITKSLNIGFREAKGKYIARMDSDDIALPTRLEKQFDYMESHPDVIVCGTDLEFFGARCGQFHTKNMDMKDYRIRLLFENPGPCHPTSFFNRELLLRHHLNYDESLIYAQDYGLWADISRYGKVCFLGEVLLRRRMHFNQITNEHRGMQIQCEKKTQMKLLKELLGNVTEEEVDLHYLCSSRNNRSIMMNKRIMNWYLRLIRANNKVAIYDKSKLKSYIYNNIIMRIIYQSFEPDMGYSAKIAMLFRYLPLPIVLRSLTRIGARMIVSRVHYNSKR